MLGLSQAISFVPVLIRENLAIVGLYRSRPTASARCCNRTKNFDLAFVAQTDSSILRTIITRCYTRRWAIIFKNRTDDRHLLAKISWQCWNLFKWGDWKRGTGHRETIKIVGTDIARLDNAAPYRRGGQSEIWQCGTRKQGWTTRNWTTRDHIGPSKGGHRETWQRGTRSNTGVHFYRAMLAQSAVMRQ